MSTVLLPCPFCGGAAIQCGNNDMNPRHWVMCEACHACPGGDVPELAGAIAAWNRRSSLAIRAGVTEAMVNAADSVLSRRRPGIPDETIRIAIAAALDVADKTPNPPPQPKMVGSNPYHCEPPEDAKEAALQAAADANGGYINGKTKQIVLAALNSLETPPADASLSDNPSHAAYLAWIKRNGHKPNSMRAMAFEQGYRAGKKSAQTPPPAETEDALSPFKAKEE